MAVRDFVMPGPGCSIGRRSIPHVHEIIDAYDLTDRDDLLLLSMSLLGRGITAIRSFYFFLLTFFYEVVAERLGESGSPVQCSSSLLLYPYGMDWILFLYPISKADG